MSLTDPCAHLSIFFFNDTPTTEIYTLSLHDALPIWTDAAGNGYKVGRVSAERGHSDRCLGPEIPIGMATRSEEHTSELQSRRDLVCRLLLEKKKNIQTTPIT